MCGRCALDAPKEDLLNQFHLKTFLDVQPRYNIAPSQLVPIIREASGLSNRMTLCRWGLIPSWSKDDKVGYKLINARSETVHEKPSFKASFKQRRCLVPAYWLLRMEGGRRQKATVLHHHERQSIIRHGGAMRRVEGP